MKQSYIYSEKELYNILKDATEYSTGMSVEALIFLINDRNGEIELRVDFHEKT